MAHHWRQKVGSRSITIFLALCAMALAAFIITGNHQGCMSRNIARQGYRLENMYVTHEDHRSFIMAWEAEKYDIAYLRAKSLSLNPAFSGSYAPFEKLGDVSAKLGDCDKACG